LTLVVLLFSLLILEKCEHKVVVNSIFVDQQVQQEAPNLMQLVQQHSQYSSETYSVFSHGRSGQLFLKGIWLDAPKIAEFLKGQIGAAKNLHIYGCQFANLPKVKKGKRLYVI